MAKSTEDRGWKRRARACGFLLLLLVAIPLLEACRVSGAHPSDAAMAREFSERRRSFDALLQMVRQETRVTRVAPDFIWIDGARNVAEADRARYLPDARLARYRKLFRALDLGSGVVRRHDGSVGFLRSSSGIVPSGSGKEFLWAPGFRGPAIGASDPRSVEALCVPSSGCTSARRLAPDWYLVFESS
ncbi:MAG: hypothetical protein V4574_19650 [Pseudomonadota bacterium]